MNGNLLEQNRRVYSFPSVPVLLVQVAAEPEAERGEQSVRDPSRAPYPVMADEAQACDAEETETHVRHAGIAPEEN